MFKRKSLLIHGLFFNLLCCISSSTHAQDLCDLEAVVQPALDQVAEDNECNLGGAFINSQAFVSLAENRCLELSEKKCRRCVEEISNRAGAVIRNLSKDGLVERELLPEIKRDLNDIKHICDDSDSVEDPIATPDPDDEDDDKDKNDREPKKTPKPEPTRKEDDRGKEPKKTPSPIPSPVPSLTPISGDAAKAMIEAACPCNGFESHVRFMECVNFNLFNGVKDGRFDRESAGKIYRHFEESSCGGKPSLTPSPLPSPFPSLPPEESDS